MDNHELQEDKQASIFYKEIHSNLKPIPQLTVFKIFGEEYFSFQKAYSESKVDWSGFYTQLTPEHSMRYLTKKWNDGAHNACLIRLVVTEFKLRLLAVQHQSLGNYKISGESKADNIKRHLKETYEEFHDIQHEKLLHYLGKHHILMSCIDCEDQQIIIPHDLLNKHHFRFEHIASFNRSNDGMLRTISFRKKRQWKKVSAQAQFEPYLLLKEEIWNEQDQDVL